MKSRQYSQAGQRISRRTAIRRLVAGATGVSLVTVLGCQPSNSSPAASGTPKPASSGATAAGATGSGTPKRGGTLVAALANDITGLDPQLDRGGTNTLAEQQMYDSLYRYVSGGTAYEPALAERYEATPDGLTYTFSLRQGLKYHDGTPLDAASYKFALEREAYADNPYHQGGAFGSWTQFWGAGFPGDVDAINAIDPHTLQFKLHRPVVDAMFAFADMTMAAISPEAIKLDAANWGKKPVGAGIGPFVFEEWQTNERLVFRRADAYWESDRPYLDRLIFRPMMEPSTRLLALQTGEIQATSISGNELKDLENNTAVRIVKGPPGPEAYLGMNHQDPIIGLKPVRQAISQALNREQLIKQLMPDTAVVAQNHGLFPGMAGYRTDLKWYPYDPQRAKQLLSEAGFPNGFDVTLAYIKEGGIIPDVGAMVQAIQGELAKVGIRVKLQLVEQTSFVQNLRADAKTGALAYQMLLNTAGNRGDSQALLRVWGGYTNYAFVQPGYTDLLNQAAIEPDEAKRQAIWGQMQQKLYDDVAYIPLAHSQSTIAARKEVNGLKAPFSEWPIYFKDVWLG